MKRIVLTCWCVFAAHVAGAAAAEEPGTVQVRDDGGTPHKLLVTGETYSMLVNCTDALIEKFTSGDQELIGDVPLCPTLNTGKVNGPGSVQIETGPVLARIGLSNLWWTDLEADIGIDLYCYPTHIFAVADVKPHGTPPDLLLGWYGGAKFSMPLVMSSEEELNKQTSFNGKNPNSAAVVAEPWIQFGHLDEKVASMINFRNSIGRISGGYGYRSTYSGPRRASIMLLACQSNDELKEAIRGLGAMPFARVSVAGAKFVRFDGSTGYFTIDQEVGSEPVNIEAAFEQPAPPPPSAPPAIMQRVAMALAKISWPVGSVMFALLAVVVFGYGARPVPGTIYARIRPKWLASAAAVVLVATTAWLFKLPPPPKPGVLPMPSSPVMAYFKVSNASPDNVLTAGDGTSLPHQTQVRALPDGKTETLLAIELAPTGTTRFALRPADQR
ncbi:MAG: hypothetical protein HUU46_05720 [Candidatus Hydrogenedentes bacterium]|nr:hypothetical protein [Candidatus Hydrogenedentota bacterium]